MIHILVLKAWFIVWVKLARDSFRLSAILPGSWPLFAPFYGVLTPSLARVLDERCFGVLICLFFMVFACLVLLLLARYGSLGVLPFLKAFQCPLHGT